MSAKFVKQIVSKISDLSNISKSNLQKINNKLVKLEQSRAKVINKIEDSIIIGHGLYYLFEEIISKQINKNNHFIKTNQITINQLNQIKNLIKKNQIKTIYVNSHINIPTELKNLNIIKIDVENWFNVKDKITPNSYINHYNMILDHINKPYEIKNNIEIRNPYIRKTYSKNHPSSVYMEIKNRNNFDIYLTKVDSNISEVAKLRQTYVDETGIIKSHNLDKIVIPPKSSIYLKPNSIHIFLNKLYMQNKIEIELFFHTKYKAITKKIEIKKIL
jgi:copper(I)-binding protein